MLFLKSVSNPAYPENKSTAQMFLNKILDSPTSDPFYKYRASFFAYDMGYRDEAYINVSKLLAADPINLEYLQGMVFLEESKNDISKLIEVRQRIAAVDPWNAENYLQLLKLYKSTGDTIAMEAMKVKISSFAAGTDIAKTAAEIIG